MSIEFQSPQERDFWEKMYLIVREQALADEAVKHRRARMTDNSRDALPYDDADFD